MHTTTLIAASDAKVKGMLEIRERLAREEAEGGGRTTTSRSNWTPWGRAYNRRVQRARNHAGEVKLSVDTHGCLVRIGRFLVKLIPCSEVLGSI